jgi:phosphatidylinositol alpha-1,6-mannosyltransferase
MQDANMKPSARVLVLAWNFPPAVGGMESVAMNLVAGLPRCGHEVFTIARYAPGRDSDASIVRPSRPGLLAYQVFSFFAGWRRLRGAGADVLVCPGIASAPVAWCLSRRFRIPWLVLAHGSDVMHGGWWYRACMKFLFRRAAGVPANSGHTQELLLSVGCSPDRIRVIHPGVDEAPFPALADDAARALREKNQLRGRRVLLSAGRLVRRKGIAEFVEYVMPALLRRFPGLVYVVAGGDATASLAHSERLLESLRQRVRDVGMSDHVQLLGNVSDAHLRELYYSADLLVLPSIPVQGDVEGFGIVFLEAALAQTPAVATKLGGIPDAVEHGLSGILLDPGDWNGLAQAIGELLDDEPRRKELGASARRRVLARFTWPTIVRQYADFIGEIVARASRRPGAR